MQQKINWFICQSNSDQILAEGMFNLQRQDVKEASGVKDIYPGNYLISLNSRPPYYVGEAKNVATRIKQQFKVQTSTFFKTTLKFREYEHLLIHMFRVQNSETKIGRKELEEFSIVNIPTQLNKFQLGKRTHVAPAKTSTLWLHIQSQHDMLLAEAEQAVLKNTYHPWFDATVPHLAGVYIVRRRNNEELIYIGESSDIGERYETHSGRTYFSALRRHIGTEILGFKLKTIKQKSRYFSQDEDDKVNQFLRTCQIGYLPISFGRFELEEFLIKKYHPLLNLKDNDIAI